MTKIAIIGGSRGKESGIINKLEEFFFLSHTDAATVSTYNGGGFPTDLFGQDLVLWFPDIDNKEQKNYPVKDKGTVLICSKVMREDTTRIDAVSRIFNMHGNAVVAISLQQWKRSCTYCKKQYNCNDKECSKYTGWHAFLLKHDFEFELIDALNNTWCKTTNIAELVDKINALYKWTKESKRRSLKQYELKVNLGVPSRDLEKFININRKLALKVAEGCGNRFFGNYSTRCTKLFPSIRDKKVSIARDMFFFSPRNTDKRFVEVNDLVLVDHEYYYNSRKPSVDTPVQLELYKHFPNINYMIHGHAYIKEAPTTDHYYPCGDLRETKEIIRLINRSKHSSRYTKINLKNHGFLITACNLKHMQEQIDKCVFYAIGELQ